LLFPLIFSKQVFAQDSSRPTTTMLSANETYTGTYFATNESVRLSGVVQGDAYIGGGSITIDGTITNDLIGGGGNILITGEVNGDVRIAGGTVTLAGAEIGGNVTVLGGQITFDRDTQIGGGIVSSGGNIQILSSVRDTIYAAGGSITIGNSVNNDINARVGRLIIEDGAQINGNVTYWSETRADISESASISGAITQQMPKTSKKNPEVQASEIASIFFFIRLADVILLLIAGLILITMFPIYTKRVSEYMKTNMGISLFIGLLAVIFIPIVSIILMLTFFGIPLGLFFIILFFGVLWFVRIFALLLIGRFILDKTYKDKGDIWALTVGVTVYFILSLLPIISMIIDLIIVLLGMGGFFVAKKQYYSELRRKRAI